MVTAATQKECRSLWGRGDGEDHRSESKLGEKKKWRITFGREQLCFFGEYARVREKNYGVTCYKVHVSCILVMGVAISPVDFGVFFFFFFFFVIPLIRLVIM